MSSQPLPPKKVVALAILEQSKVRLHLDPRADGVVVPLQFKRQPQLLLDIGLNLPVPIPDLYLDDDKITCTLSFGGRPFYCILPWPSIFAMVGDDGRGMVWPDSLPPEVVAAQSMPKEAKPKLTAVPPPPPSEARVEKEEKKPAAKKAVASKKASPAKMPGAKKAKAAPAKKNAAVKSVKKTAKKEKPKAAPKKAAKKVAKKAAKPSAPKPVKPVNHGSKKSVADTLPEAPVVHLPKSAGASKREEPPRAAQGKKPVTTAGRPKRELPPYLRVVK
ncbi:MAG: hypothetical protein ABI551_10960 [Polyangiaceae bacterium]